jgi:hypothetical protein
MNRESDVVEQFANFLEIKLVQDGHQIPLEDVFKYVP